MKKGKFKIFTGKDGQFYFHLEAGNGKILLHSEGYTEKHNAVNAIKLFKEWKLDASILPTENKQKYVKYIAKNGEPIAHTETYKQPRSVMLKMITRVRRYAELAAVIDETKE